MNYTNKTHRWDVYCIAAKKITWQNAYLLQTLVLVL